MKLQTIILSLLAALFAGVVTFQLHRRLGLGAAAARWCSFAIAVAVFVLSMWLRK